MFEEIINYFTGNAKDQQSPFFILVSNGVRGIETYYNQEICDKLPTPYKKQIVEFLFAIINNLDPKGHKEILKRIERSELMLKEIKAKVRNKIAEQKKKKIEDQKKKDGKNRTSDT